ncbi:TasA family protein [Brevibacillus sp. NPDC003359]|uniref:TasA family protein n=1 Tax=unclassified Brevibacillus TaxID=2684853 RepID=UPI0036B8FEA6
MKKWKSQFMIALAAVGVGSALVGGATFAYFSDQEVVNNTFAAGTLDLSVNKQVVYDVKNIKPGDYMVRYFTIKNSGTLDIEKVLMHSKYTVSDAKGDNGTEDFGDHLYVEFLTSDGQVILLNESLGELQRKTSNGQSPDISTLYTSLKKLPVGDEDTIAMKVIFKENGQDQNKFQGDTLSLTWNLEAFQGKGTEL